MQAELSQAGQGGTLLGADTLVPADEFRAGKSRQEVVSDVLAGRTFTGVVLFPQ